MRYTLLPVDERAYHQFWRVPRLLAWRPIVAVLLGVVAFFAVTLLLSIPAVWSSLDKIKDPGDLVMTPALFLANNLGLAALIPISMVMTRWLLRQPPAFLSSVIGGLRWRWLFTCVAVIVPIWAIQAAIEFWLSWGELNLAVGPDTTAMIVIILGTQVFQCAGEEYGFRGLLNRAVGALIPGEVASFVIAGAASSVVFMFSHGARDPWLNLFYFVFGMCAAYLTWRTGGLEAAIAVHCVNNLFAMSTLPFSDISAAFSREAGVGSPWMLLNMAVLVAATALLSWLGTRRGLVTRTAPGRALLPPPPPWARRPDAPM